MQTTNNYIASMRTAIVTLIGIIVCLLLATLVSSCKSKETAVQTHSETYKVMTSSVRDSVSEVNTSSDTDSTESEETEVIRAVMFDTSRIDSDGHHPISMITTSYKGKKTHKRIQSSKRQDIKFSSAKDEKISSSSCSKSKIKEKSNPQIKEVNKLIKSIAITAIILVLIFVCYYFRKPLKVMLEKLRERI